MSHSHHKPAVDKTKRSSVKCENCEFYNEEKTAILYLKNKAETWPICEIHNEPVRCWHRCKFFGWRPNLD